MLANLERMGEKSAQNLLDEIEASQEKQSWPSDLCAGHCGSSVNAQGANSSADHVGDLAAIEDASAEQLMEVGEVDPKWPRASQNFSRRPANRELVKKLRKAGVKITEERRKPAENRLHGPHVCLHRLACPAQPRSPQASW